MPFNQLKEYPGLLEILHLSEYERNKSLKGIFKRDIEDNQHFKYRGKPIFPVKKDGQPTMETLFAHLITVEDKDNGEKNTPKTRSFDPDRSMRLHWIKHHIEKDNVTIFSYEDRIRGKSIIRTYIYDKDQKYVIILEPRKEGIELYYLITAYYLNEKRGLNQMKSKIKNKLDEVY